jgi:hypothetical protein
MDMGFKVISDVSFKIFKDCYALKYEMLW